MPQEMIAAGPAVASAPCAPNSQPEPMIEPPEAHSRPMKPISRRRPGLRGRLRAAVAGTCPVAAEVAIGTRIRAPRDADILRLEDPADELCSGYRLTVAIPASS
jgi:hypothetical protein